MPVQIIRLHSSVVYEMDYNKNAIDGVYIIKQFSLLNEIVIYALIRNSALLSAQRCIILH